MELEADDDEVERAASLCFNVSGLDITAMGRLQFSEERNGRFREKQLDVCCGDGRLSGKTTLAMGSANDGAKWARKTSI